jgi:hypothetical protein
MLPLIVQPAYRLPLKHIPFFIQPWLWEWNYHAKIWNNIYRKMEPDDLHTIFCGVLGKHFINILTKVGNQLDMERTNSLKVNNTLFDAAFGWTGGKERRRDENPPVLLELPHF